MATARRRVSDSTTENVFPLVTHLGIQPHPSKIYPLFRHDPYPLLLDSALPGVPDNRYSYITSDPFIVLTSKGNTVTVQQSSDTRTFDADPFVVLKSLLDSYRLPRINALPPFQGGACGYLSYDLGRLWENLPEIAQDDLTIPDLCLPFYDWVLAHDNVTNQTFLISTGFPDHQWTRANERMHWALSKLEARLTGSIKENPIEMGSQEVITLPSSSLDPVYYLTAVGEIQRYLASGDVYQVNLSHRFKIDMPQDLWSLYQRLRTANPAPYSVFMEYPNATILGASPEEFLSLDESQVTTRPIKGTRPRGITATRDAAFLQQLQTSSKDKAENLMIVDLLRNDLGRVCRPGSVVVPDLFGVEAHPTVWHLVSKIVGTLGDGQDAIDLLKACFPGGSVTGAPKIRAMEIIEELEPIRRGIYCGAIGYIGFNGLMKTSLTIRTMIATKGSLFLSVGGGIVADSDPTDEYLETIHKARGILRALNIHI